MDLKEVQADVTLDFKGLSCPMPLLNTKKALKKITAGQVVEILVTDPGFKKDLPELLKKTGDELMGDFDAGEGFYHVFLKKA